MKSIFLNLGEGFKDDKLQIFKRELEKRMEVITFDHVSENIGEINAIEEQGAIFYFETAICRKNKNYIQAFCSVVNLIGYLPSAVYLMPVAPKELVKAIKKQWPNVGIFEFQYDIMKPAEQIN